MKRKFIAAILAILLSVLVLTGCGCDHEWDDATCTEPKTCSKCGETEGEALGHTWSEADCEHPKTCAVCGLTEGDPLGHTEGSWETVETDLVNATETLKKNCTVCSAELDKKATALDQLHDNEIFLFSPRQFTLRLDKKFDEMVGNYLSAASGSREDTFTCDIFLDGEGVGAFMFSHNDDAITTSQRKDACFNQILGAIEGSDYIARVLVAFIGTCDPSLSFSEVKEMASDLNYDGTITKNGLTYAFMGSDGLYVLGVTIEP